MITIQRPVKEDAKDIQQVLYKTWLVTYPNAEAGITVEDIEERFKDRFSPAAIQKRIAEILDISESNLFLVAKEKEKVIGVCRATKKETYNQLMAIYILQDYQRKGIGKMFWKEVLEFFGNEKDAIVRVATYNTQAITFYKKLGFTDTGKRFTEEHFRMPISGSHIPEMELIIKSPK
jgi:ribosomal protein S18 acetylase RimI-like enzyme